MPSFILADLLVKDKFDFGMQIFQKMSECVNFGIQRNSNFGPSGPGILYGFSFW